MTTPLHRIGRTWRRAADREQRLRAERDAEIRRARDAGLGVREIARAAEVDPTQVLRVLRRGDLGAELERLDKDMEAAGMTDERVAEIFQDTEG